MFVHGNMHEAQFLIHFLPQPQLFGTQLVCVPAGYKQELKRDFNLFTNSAALLLSFLDPYLAVLLPLLHEGLSCCQTVHPRMVICTLLLLSTNQIAVVS